MGALPAVLNMVLGNPLTSVPGALLVTTQAGNVVHELGDVLIEIGAGGSPWTAALKFAQSPSIATFTAGVAALFAKDFNRHGAPVAK